MLTIDRPTARERRRSRERFVRSGAIETEYSSALKKIARQIGELADGLFPEEELPDTAALSEFDQLMRRYGVLITPWARATAARMLSAVGQKDEKDWAKTGEMMSRALAQEVKSAPTGELFTRLMAEQVNLITSLPLEAAKRVHELTMRGLEGSVRAKDVAKEILRTSEVTRSRAMLIARTEVARTASTLTQARAEYVGSEGYIWRTALDPDVRKEHKVLEGKFIRWDTPPVAGSDGTRAHAGQIYNCRCYPEVVVPDVVV